MPKEFVLLAFSAVVLIILAFVVKHQSVKAEIPPVLEIPPMPSSLCLRGFWSEEHCKVKGCGISPAVFKSWQKGETFYYCGSHFPNCERFRQIDSEEITDPIGIKAG
jgi:hypothetical protein